MRPIDADALKEWFPDSGEGSWTYNVTVKACIDAQPSIDAVQVIRCAECYFWDKEPSQTAMPEVHTCRFWRIGTICVDYCARASRDGWLKAMSGEVKK